MDSKSSMRRSITVVLLNMKLQPAVLLLSLIIRPNVLYVSCKVLHHIQTVPSVCSSPGSPSVSLFINTGVQCHDSRAWFSAGINLSCQERKHSELDSQWMDDGCWLKQALTDTWLGDTEGRKKKNTREGTHYGNILVSVSTTYFFLWLTNYHSSLPVSLFQRKVLQWWPIKSCGMYRADPLTL